MQVEVDKLPEDPSDDLAVDLGRGLCARLGDLRALSNPDCRTCSRGILWLRDGKGGHLWQVCGCAVRAWVKRLRGDDPVTLVGRTVKTEEAAARERELLGELEAACAAAREECARRKVERLAERAALCRQRHHELKGETP